MNEHTLAVWSMLAGGHGYLRLDWRDPGHGADTTLFPVHDRKRFTERIEWLTARGTVEVGACTWLDLQTTGESWVCWARLESGESGRLLDGFTPAPTMVLRDGGTVRQTALWALSKPLRVLGTDYREEANRRLAHALKTAKKHAAVEFVFRPPGAFRRAGGGDLPVVVTRFDRTAVYDPGFLRRLWAPDVNAWRGRQAA